MGVEKDFLGFMLRDGGSGVLVENEGGKEKSLKVEWVEMS